MTPAAAAAKAATLSKVATLKEEWEFRLSSKLSEIESLRAQVDAKLVAERDAP